MANSLGISRDELLALLGRFPLRIGFTKVNGEYRLMTCTRAIHLLPEDEQYAIKEAFDNAVNLPHFKPNVIAVWDMVASGWRSFRVENVQSVEIIAV